MSLYQIMYISTAISSVSVEDSAAIARLSARNNARDDVTGLLLFNSKRFLQVLEGSREAVERIFARVYADPRHRAVVKLHERVIEKREFGNWAMAFDDPRHPADPLRTVITSLLERAGPSTRAHFLGAAELHRASA